MINEAIGAAALGAIVLAAAALIPGLGGTLRKVGYAAGLVLVIAGAGLFFWPVPSEAPPPIQSAGEQPNIPPPSGQLAKFTNDELADGARTIAQVISDYAQANESAALDIKQKDYTA